MTASLTATPEDLRALNEIRNKERGKFLTKIGPIPRRVALLVILLALWQAYVSIGGVDSLLVSSPVDVAKALFGAWTDGTMSSATLTTLRLLGTSLLIGILAALVLVALATVSTIAADFLILLSSILNPLPSIAILPLAIIWFGLNESALIFVVANAVLWPVAINIYMGFKTVNPTILAVSRNIGVRGTREITDVLLPSALPHILTGIRTAIAFGWRTIVAAELVFGVAGGEGGIGYYINQSRFFLQIPEVFAALVTIAIIGVFLEALFTLFERSTVERWGMKNT